MYNLNKINKYNLPLNIWNSNFKIEGSRYTTLVSHWVLEPLEQNSNYTESTNSNNKYLLSAIQPG